MILLKTNSKYVVICFAFLWIISCAPSLENIQPVDFNADDEGKIKIALFSELLIPPNYWQSAESTQQYNNILDSVRYHEPKYKIIINPFKISVFSMKKYFAIKAGQKMGVDFVLFIIAEEIINTDWWVDHIKYELINIHDKDVFKGELKTTNMSSTAIASRILWDCSTFLSSVSPPKMNYTLSISSTPSGAGIYLDHIYREKTPATIEVSKGWHNIKIEKDGYQTVDDALEIHEDDEYSYVLKREEAIDNEPPKIRISSPINNFKTINEKIFLTGDIIDNIKLKKVEIVLNNKISQHSFQEIRGKAFILTEEVKLNTGRNDIIVQATDLAGHTAQKSLVVYRIEPVTERPAKIEKFVTLPKTDKYYAVVIGIGKYQDDRIPKLKYATIDAEKIYNILTDPQHGNFPKTQIKLLIDEQATDNNIKSAIGTWLRRNTRKDDTVIIFFAGHGAPEDEKTYWVTFNANIDDLYGTALSNDEIADMLDRVEARKMIAFLDSCYSAATVHRTDKKRGVMITKDPFQKFKGKGRVIITSSDGKEQSLEIQEFGHGIFTYYLLKALKGEADENNDGYVELDEVWDYVKYRVTDTARKHGSIQTPIIDGSYSAGIVISAHPERLRELELMAVREKKEKDLEIKIAKLTELYNKGELTDSQFDKAVRILESGEKNKLLEKFLSDKISLTTFRRVFK